MNGTALNFHYDFLTSYMLTDPEFFTKKVPFMKAAGVRTVWLDNYIYGEWQNTPEEASRAKAMLEAEGFEVQAICVPLGHGSNALNGDEADPTLPVAWQNRVGADGNRQGTTTCVDEVVFDNYRKALKAAGGEYAGITLGDIVLYAVSRTLLNHPDLNANMLDDNSIRHFKHVNLGVAVDTPRGLMVPTIRHADEMSLLEISKAVKELAAECRDGAISPDKLSGGSFTVSNLGNMGVESFTPVINPPQTGILGVCGTIDRVRKGKDGGIEIYPAMGLSLTYDHRAVDGTPAAKFQQELCHNLEHFTTLLAK